MARLKIHDYSSFRFLCSHDRWLLDTFGWHYWGFLWIQFDVWLGGYVNFWWYWSAWWKIVSHHLCKDHRLYMKIQWVPRNAFNSQSLNLVQKKHVGKHQHIKFFWLPILAVQNSTWFWRTLLSPFLIFCGEWKATSPTSNSVVILGLGEFWIFTCGVLVCMKIMLSPLSWIHLLVHLKHFRRRIAYRSYSCPLT